MNKPLTFTPEKRDQLREAYEKAKAAGAEVFTFEGHELLVAYTKYLLEYLDSMFGGKS
jgi:hypothetical protein